ncbi:MAG: response regulator [Lachnospiraceae bacterium]|nr:response regulator [Lachnospiraceae bacterium]
MERNYHNLEKLNKDLRNALAEAARAEQKKTDYMAHVTRNIRIPLSTISGMTTIARRNIEDNNKILDCFDKIEMASNQLMRIVDEITDMSELNDRTLLINEAPFFMGELLWHTVEKYIDLAHERNITLRIISDKVIHEHLIGDYERISQALGNILSNAINYTLPGGEVKITVNEVHAFRDGCSLFDIIFEDTGVGMDSEFMNSMYQPFQRADDERIAAKQGVGLGLPIAMRLIRMMSGDIKAVSDFDIGSKFTVSLHLRRQKEIVFRSNLKDMRILVVDDDETEVDNIRDLFAELEIAADFVSYNHDYKELIKTAVNKDKPYCAVLCAFSDIGERNDFAGYHLAKAIASEFADKAPQTLFISNWWENVPEMKEFCNINDFITRPLNREKVLYALEHNFQEERLIPSENLPEISFAGKRILVAEDNQLNAEMIKEILMQHGIIVEVAENGMRVLDMLMNKGVNYFDCILMDVKMPVMNGYMATEKIRASKREDIAKIPIIAMTADAYSIDVRSSKNAGMNTHVAKPFNINELLAILGSLLSNG